MDLRIERTKRSIINAFIELRSKKPLEKITVKELATLAFINKATFYLHYNDIYDLTEQLENETIDKIISCIPHPEYMITKPRETTEMLAIAFISQNRLIDILFSDSRASILVNKIESKIKERIFATYPEYRNDLEKEVLLTMLIQGSFYAFLENRKNADFARLIEIVGRISEQMLVSTF